MRTILHYREQIPAEALILHNGAIIVCGTETIFHSGIEPDVAKHILCAIAADHPQATLSVEINDTLYANFDVPEDWNASKAVMTDFNDLPPFPADKIIIGVSSADDMKRYNRYVPEHLYLELSSGKLGLIMNRSASKAGALRTLAGHCGWKLSDMTAFGDDCNDREMLRDCGTGVAMQNALDEIKESADHICGDNDNDGVARWLLTNVLKERT